MKKKYIAPNMEEIELNFESFLFNTSGSTSEDTEEEVVFKDNAFSINNPMTGIDIE